MIRYPHPDEVGVGIKVLVEHLGPIEDQGHRARQQAVKDAGTHSDLQRR